MWHDVSEALTQAAARVATGIAGRLPGLLALILAVLLALLTAWIVRLLLRRFLRGIHFDAWMHRWDFTSMAEWSPEGSPTLLITRVVSWAVVVVGVLVGLVAVEPRLESQVVWRVFGYLPNVVVALTLLFLGMLLARFLARGALIAAVNLHIRSARVLSLAVKWLVLIVATAMALDQANIGGTILRLAFAILFAGIVLALSLAIGLGSKDLVSRTLERQTRDETKGEEDSMRHL